MLSAIPALAHQVAAAEVVRDKLLGLVSNIDLTKDELLNLYYEIDLNKIIGDNCKKYQKIIRNENGGEKAADVLVSFIKAKTI